MSQRLLIVDDDEAVRETLRYILEAFEIVEASSAIEALDLISSGQHFDAVVCDLIMPGMTGAELHQSLDPASPLRGSFIFMTGGFLPKVVKEFLDEVDPPLMSKPFDIHAVKAAVSTLLG